MHKKKGKPENLDDSELMLVMSQITDELECVVEVVIRLDGSSPGRRWGTLVIRLHDLAGDAPAGYCLETHTPFPSSTATSFQWLVLRQLISAANTLETERTRRRASSLEDVDEFDDLF